MPSFSCTVCQAAFEVPQSALDKYSGWQPKYCREHSPAKAPKASRSSRASRKPSRGGGRGGSRTEENLTLAEVLVQYSGGPTTGLFTDGSSVPNPGPGGWGVVWVEDGEVREQRHGHDPDTTNNRMELQALIEAFRLLPADAVATIHSDSRLCIDTITKWAHNWKKKGWKKKGGPIKNLELVQELFDLAAEHPDTRLEWIAAHSGNRWNEYADSLSTAWMRAEL